MIRSIGIVFLSFSLTGCAGPPDSISPEEADYRIEEIRREYETPVIKTEVVGIEDMHHRYEERREKRRREYNRR